MERWTGVGRELVAALGQLAGGPNADPAHAVPRFVVPAVCWLALAAVARRQHWRSGLRRDRLVGLAALVGAARELGMLAAEYGSFRGFLSWEAVVRLYPPVEHLVSLLVVVAVALAFLEYVHGRRAWLRPVLLGAAAAAVAVTAAALPDWWGHAGAALQAGDGRRVELAEHWSEIPYRLVGLAVAAAVLVGLRPRRAADRAPGRLLVAAFLCFGADDLLQLANVATGLAHAWWLAPLRHALHMAGVPLLLAVYWSEQTGTLRRSEAALREASAHHRRLFEAMPDPLLAVRGDGRIADANAAALEAVQATHAALVGAPLAACFVEGEAVRQALRDAAEGRPVRDLALAFTWQGSPPRHVLLNAATVGFGILVSLRDVTDLRRADAARRTMERAVAEAQRLESLGVLAAGVAHDFNNLLSAALANGTQALAALPPGSPAREAAEALVAASRRAADLTRQMMACAGGALVEPVPVALGPLARELGGLLRATVGARKALEVEAPAEGPVLLADPTQLRQVLTNLVLNAAEAMGDRAGRIAVRVHAARLDAAALAEGMVPEAGPGEYAVLEVADDGPGMSEATRARIFEPFFTTKVTGRGLGLASVMGVVRGHGGGIQVETAEGRGTTFRVLLPRPPGAALPAPAAVAPRGEAAGPLAARVLVVDDDDLIRSTARRLLRSAGHVVHLAASGPEALRFLEVRSAEVEVVVLDLSMPGMDGAEVLRALRARWPSLRVVVSSGWAGEETRRRLGGAPVEALALKPWGPAELDEAVQRALAAGRPPAAA